MQLLRMQCFDLAGGNAIATLEQRIQLVKPSTLLNVGMVAN
jgi:hypothetical protein